MNTSPASTGLALALTPAGNLWCQPDPQATPLSSAVADRLAASFAAGSGHGLLYLGAALASTALPPVWAYWRDFSASYLTARCTTVEDAAVLPPDEPTLESLLADAPLMAGAEYLSRERLVVLWTAIGVALESERTAAGQSLEQFLKARNPAWNRVGRVHFNLAENRQDPEAPFAFLATYTTRLSAHGKAQHLPLSRALAEFSGSKKKAQLL